MKHVFSNTKEPRRCKYLTIHSFQLWKLFSNFIQSQEEKQIISISHLVIFPPGRGVKVQVSKVCSIRASLVNLVINHFIWEQLGKEFAGSVAAH